MAATSKIIRNLVPHSINIEKVCLGAFFVKTLCFCSEFESNKLWTCTIFPNLAQNEHNTKLTLTCSNAKVLKCPKKSPSDTTLPCHTSR